MNHAQSILHEPVSIVILAGGRSTRMQGQDKGLVTLNGIPLAQRIYRDTSSQSNDIAINANQNIDRYRQLLPDCHIVSDHWADFRGPLAGIHAAITHCHHDYLWVIPCDLYKLPDNCLEKMRQTIQHHQCTTTYAVINDDALYPLCLLHKSTLDALQTSLEQQHYAVRHWLFEVEALPTYFHMPLDIPLHLNTPEALQSAAHFEQQVSTNQQESP